MLVPLHDPHLTEAFEGEAVDAARLLVASLAGDGFAVEAWTELVVRSGSGRLMLHPSSGGEPVRIPAVPSVLLWEDGVLVDVLVGVERFAERRPGDALLTSVGQTEG